jgi:formylglycine-generating enzyme required for sulfatase activity
MGENPSYFTGENFPVEQVSWEDCQVFCRETGLRLPTEAGWEHACRAGSDEAFCFAGDATRLGEYAWYREDAGRRTHPVGKKKPNAFGLHDMHGNVCEWCEDVYNVFFYRMPGATQKNPVCAHTWFSDSEVRRVVRGGCWGLQASWCRSAARASGVPSARSDMCGFRPVWSGFE